MYFNLEICLYLTETLRGVDWWWLVVRAPLLLISAPVRCAVVEAVDEAHLRLLFCVEVNRESNLVPALDVVYVNLVAVHVLVPEVLLALDEGSELLAVVVTDEAVDLSIF